MARYIDADKLIEMCKRQIECEWNTIAAPGTWADAFQDFSDLVEQIPTADVVPRSEVKKLEAVIDTLKDTNEHLAVMLEEAKSEVAREIFKEINSIFQNQFEKCSEESELKLLEPIRQCERFTINELWIKVAKLKKKYTEGERDGS